uniref:CCDC144C-like coiled-coil domain-containing protein n=1 Tax=Petromyzon marinus TaxID=7757 RepID=S4RJT0_PETMA
KLKQVETERSAVKKALSEMTRSKEGLEEEKVNLESDLDALRYYMKQERENGRGVATLYEKCQAQLQLKEEQLLLEEKDKRHAEHSLQSVQLEKSIAEQRMQLLEKKLSEIQPDLENERKLRLQQERILDEHLQKQQQSHEERENNSTSTVTIGEELGRPSLALDNSKLQEEISVLNRDMQRQSASFREREELLMNEKNTLLENLEALRRKVNLNEDALQLEQETVGRERALEELETVRKQLLRATSERGDGLEENGGPGQPERRQRRRDATELQELLEREGLLSQQLSRTESRCSELESERHRQSLELVEKDHALETCRRELGAARQRAEELDVALRGGREETAKLLVREESQKERMVQAQSDNLLLRQQLQEASAKVLQKEAVVTGIQDRFDDLLSKLQADKNQREQVLEERNQELVASAICLKETLKKLEDEKNNNEDLLHQRKQDLADALKKLAMSEASLDFTVNHRTALEAEKSQLHNNLESQRQQVQAALQQSRREAAAHAASDHEHACSLDRDCKSLEETVKQLSEEKNALEEKLKQVNYFHNDEQRLEELTRQLQAAHDTAQSLQRSNRELEEQLRRSKRHLQVPAGAALSRGRRSRDLRALKHLRRYSRLNLVKNAAPLRAARSIEDCAKLSAAPPLRKLSLNLQSQAVSQETLEGLRSMNELHLKRLMEQKLQELEAEVERLRSNAEESQRATEHLQAELRRYTSLYQEELSCRKALSAKLER